MSGEASIRSRLATEADLDGLTATITAAFVADPLWSWAFTDPDSMATWWRFYIGSALRYPCVRVGGDYAAVAVWIPPDGTELTDQDGDLVRPLLERLAGPRAAAVFELVQRFDACHPKDERHYYLSLLGTHPKYRGRGLGMGLLAENLARVDAEGMPSYLESTNPENTPRYVRLGFRQVGEFTTPDGKRTVATMWRDAEPPPTGRRAAAPTARENAAAVVTAYEAFARGGLDRFVEHWTDDLDHRAIVGAVDDRGPVRGKDALRAYVQDWIDVFEDFRIEPVELIDAGGDQVVAILRFGGRARQSGVETDETFAAVFSIRDGRIARGREYSTREQALEAAGLGQ